MFRIKLALFLAVFLTGAALLPAQQNEQAALVRSLNNSVLQIHGQLQSAGQGAAAGLRAQGETLLAQRSAALSALIEQDASQALQLAFSDDLLATLAAAFPQSAASLESRGAFEGPIEYVILDDHTLGRHRVDIRMDVAGQTFDIHFPEHEPGGMKCGDILRVNGVKAGTQVAAADGNVTSSVAAAGCSTSGDQKIVAILVQFPGYSLPASVTPTMVNSIMFGTSGKSVHTFWQESSYGNAGASGVVVAAIAAADADVDFRLYTRIMIVFANPGSCGWAGLGMLGCGTFSSAGDGSFTASVSWLLANYMGDVNNGTKLSTHEGGHNLTLHHASSRAFTNATTLLPESLGPLGVAGTLGEYGDPFNTMGSWNFGQYNAPHKVMLGWLTGSDYQTVQSNGTFSLLPFEANTGLRSLKVQRGTGNNAYLWMEYRQPIGQFDSAINSQVYGGALVHLQDSTTGTHSHLVDMTPGSTGGFNDPAKLAGTGTFVDPYTNVSFSVDSATSSAMGVSVFYGPVPCVTSNPTVSVSPSNPSGQAGNPINYTVTVTNADSSGCTASDFLLSTTLPGGWTTTLPGSLNIAPGASVSTSMAKTAPGGTSPATYPVDTKAARGSNNGTG
ncbi:MAG: assoc protein, partial [Acidobacteria bacterium]|nr:assoc protein [Acidobacteriota bacterium]